MSSIEQKEHEIRDAELKWEKESPLRIKSEKQRRYCHSSLTPSNDILNFLFKTFFNMDEVFSISLNWRNKKRSEYFYENNVLSLFIGHCTSSPLYPNTQYETFFSSSIHYKLFLWVLFWLSFNIFSSQLPFSSIQSRNSNHFFLVFMKIWIRKIKKNQTELA